MRMVGEPIKGLVEVAGIATGADGYEREQSSITSRVGACCGSDETAHLCQGVVEDVGQPVAALDQVLDGVEPAVVTATAALV